MSGTGFLDSTGKSVTINDPENRLHDVSYFIFCSSLNPHTVDPWAPNAVRQFEFSLRLPHNSPSSFANILLPSPFVVPNQLSVPTFDITLSGISDTLLNQISATEVRDIISTRRDSLSTSTSSTISRSLKFATPNSSTTIVESISTPKMDLVRSPSSVGSTCTSTLDCWDNQTSVYNIFGLASDMLFVTSPSSRAIEEAENHR